MPITRRTAAVSFIFITIMLDMLALGMIIPVLPKLIESYAGSTAKAATIIGIFGTAWAMMQFLCSPVIGSLSDRFGRRPIVLMSNLGLGLDYILMAMAPNLTWLFVGRVISGVTAASISTSFAYVADVTPPEKRAGAFGMIGAAFGVGFVLGPALGGLLGNVEPRLPFWVAALMSLANAAYGLLVLPESLPPERRAAFSWRRANPVGSLMLLKRSRSLMGFALINFLDQLAHMVYQVTFVLYASYRYGWSTKTVGLTLTAVGVCSMVVQGGLVGRVVKAFGEKTTLLIGLVCGIAGFVLYGTAPSGLWFWAAIPLGGLWGLASPPLQGMMSQQVDGTEQGKLQGANTSLTGIAQLIGPGLFATAFASAIGEGSRLPAGIAFLISAALVSCAFIVALWTIRQVQVEPVPAE
jgi:DHA1 family tetracycline resistance protein-like MFS transporter